MAAYQRSDRRAALYFVVVAANNVFFAADVGMRQQRQQTIRQRLGGVRHGRGLGVAGWRTPYGRHQARR